MPSFERKYKITSRKLSPMLNGQVRKIPISTPLLFLDRDENIVGIGGFANSNYHLLFSDNIFSGLHPLNCVVKT